MSDRTPADEVEHEITPRYCPFCQRELEAVGLLNYNAKKERAGAICTTHGDIEIEWSRRQTAQEGHSTGGNS